MDATVVTDEVSSEETDLMKPEYKRYKRRDKPVDLSEVIDFLQNDQNPMLKKFELLEPSHPAVRGLKKVQEWKAYTIDGFPGFLFIQNPFVDGHQRYWLERCILDYPEKPSKTNLDVHMDTNSLGNIWTASQNHDGEDITGKDSLFMKLRWVTMGYNYEWNSRSYCDDMKSTFPDDLYYLCRYIAAAIGYPDFKAETAIVNYYHLDGNMGPHKDISEIDHDAPLLSFSFGQDSLFLLGGLTKATKPVCLTMHSGDICIMSKECRLVYHAVPRIMPADTKMLEKRLNLSEEERDTSFTKHCNSGNDVDISRGRKNVNMELFKKYLQCTRVNMNVRQVLPPGGKAISDFEKPVCPSMLKEKYGQET